MIRDFIGNHVYMSSILFLGLVSLLFQLMVTISLKGYVKASANMKTTRKKIMINLRNQFEAIYGINNQIHNINVYVEKYLFKMRFLGYTFWEWEKLPFLTAGIITLFAGGEAFYSYRMKENLDVQMEILFAYGIVMVSLFICFHIFGIKGKREQIQIQLVDYLENYLTNRLIRMQGEDVGEDKIESFEIEDVDTVENTERRMDSMNQEEFSEDVIENSEMEKDMEMLKRLIKKMDKDVDQGEAKEIAASKEPERTEESEIELLEEFVQSFLA